MASDYLTVQEFKYTGEISSTFADADIQLAITAASRGIDEYTDRFFYTSSGTQQMLYEWCGERTIAINDVITVGTVDVDYDRNGTYETVWSQGTHFMLEPYNAAFQNKPYEEMELLPMALYYRPIWWPPLVRVTGQFGWPAVPAPVKEATTILATRLLRRAREAPFGVVGLGIDNTAVRISKVDADVAFLLDPYLKGDGVLAA